MKKRLLLMAVFCGALMLIPGAAMTQSNDDQIAKEALATMVGFYDAFNKGDNDALQEYMTYPHVFMQRNGSVRIIEERWNMNFDRMRESQDWVKSTLDETEATTIFQDKVHFNITFSRHNSEGEVYLTQKGVWVVTKKDGKWGVQLRSY